MALRYLWLVMLISFPFLCSADTKEELKEETMAQAAMDLGFKSSDTAYAKAYSRIAGAGVVILLCVAGWVLIRRNNTQGASEVSGEAGDSKIITQQVTQVAYGVKAILLKVDGKDVLLVQTKEGHTVTQLLDEPADPQNKR